MGTGVCVAVGTGEGVNVVVGPGVLGAKGDLGAPRDRRLQLKRAPATNSPIRRRTARFMDTLILAKKGGVKQACMKGLCIKLFVVIEYKIINLIRKQSSMTINPSEKNTIIK
jgi:hypothetical protein